MYLAFVKGLKGDGQEKKQLGHSWKEPSPATALVWPLRLQVAQSFFSRWHLLQSTEPASREIHGVRPVLWKRFLKVGALVTAPGVCGASGALSGRVWGMKLRE